MTDPNEKPKDADRTERVPPPATPPDTDDPWEGEREVESLDGMTGFILPGGPPPATP